MTPDASALEPSERELLAEQFEASRSRLRAVAYRMLGSVSDGCCRHRVGGPFAVMACTVRDGRVAEIDILADPDRLMALDLTELDLPQAARPGAGLGADAATGATGAPGAPAATGAAATGAAATGTAAAVPARARSSTTPATPAASDRAAITSDERR
jgi:hypothetical protein